MVSGTGIAGFVEHHAWGGMLDDKACLDKHLKVVVNGDTADAHVLTHIFLHGIDGELLADGVNGIDECVALGGFATPFAVHVLGELFAYKGEHVGGCWHMGAGGCEKGDWIVG